MSPNTFFVFSQWVKQSKFPHELNYSKGPSVLSCSTWIFKCWKLSSQVSSFLIFKQVIFSLSKILPLFLFNFSTTTLNKFFNILNETLNILCQYVCVKFIYENNIVSVNIWQNYLLPFFLFPSLSLPLFSTKKLVINIKTFIWFA